MKYIIKKQLIKDHLEDEYFKQALVEEVQLYVDTYFRIYQVKVLGEWEEEEVAVADQGSYKNEKIESWVIDLLDKF